MIIKKLKTASNSFIKKKEDDYLVPNPPPMLGVRVGGGGLAPGAQLLVYHLRVAALAYLLVG